MRVSEVAPRAALGCVWKKGTPQIGGFPDSFLETPLQQKGALKKKPHTHTHTHTPVFAHFFLAPHASGRKRPQPNLPKHKTDSWRCQGFGREAHGGFFVNFQGTGNWAKS